MPDDLDSDDLLLGRLHESASGDTAVRQLRRRYDLLRHDYEILLDRLSEIEARLESELPGAASPSRSGHPAATLPSNELIDALEAPLARLRDEYSAAAEHIDAIVGGLDSLSAGTFRGQHPARPDPRVRADPDALRHVQVEARGQTFGALLDFQERLAALPGVARVSINAIDPERATLVVELIGQPGLEED